MRHNVKNSHLVLSVVLRFIVYCAFSATAATAIVLSLDYQRHRLELIKSQDQESLRLSLASKSITRDLREVFADLRILAHLKVLEDYFNNDSDNARTDIENAFINLGESARIYDQIRFIDRSGLEKIRVNFRTTTAVRVPISRMQDKSNRYYVSETLKLGRGEIYISPLDLNVEHGRIERPFKPMLRVAMPVFDRSGDLKGMVVLNYLADEILSDFRGVMASSWGEPNLVNARGYWLYSPNKQEEWGFMFNNSDSFANRYPEAWQYISEHESGEIQIADGTFLFATARPYSSDVTRDLRMIGGNITERYWKLISWVPWPRLAYSPLQTTFARLDELLGLWTLMAVLSLLLAAWRSQYAAKSKALRENESLLAEAQQLVHIGNWVWDIPSSTLSWSWETYKIFGLTPQHNVSYDTFLALIHPDDRDTVQESINAALQGKGEYQLDHRIVRVDNSQRTVHERGSVTFDKSGAPVRMFGTVQDITERKRIEEQLRDSEERFRQLAENINDVFWLTQWPENRVIYVSPAFERIWGITGQQLYDDPMVWTLTIVENDRLKSEQAFSNVVATGGFDLNYRIIRPDGEERWIRDRAFLIRDEHGEVYRIAGIATDITVIVQAQQELQRYKDHLEQMVEERSAELQASNRELETFNYSLAHDLRTPLRAVTSFAQILSQDSSRLSNEEKEHLQRITKAGKHMAVLLDGISELGRISRSKMKKQSVDLSEIGQKVIDKLRQKHPNRTVTVKIAPHMLCEGDRGLLSIALNNLLHNAWKCTEENPNARIEFAVSRENNITIYYVRDNGIGFNMKYATRLFEPFQHLHEVNHLQGTGIGLAVVHRIIQRHKGRVWAESSENTGATFYFTLAESLPVANRTAANG